MREDTKPEDARWEAWDRNKLIKLVDKLPNTIRIGVSNHNECQYEAIL